jgi:Dolichyl-phosphate-mannose-protein mannosyltransferase
MSWTDRNPITPRERPPVWARCADVAALMLLSLAAYVVENGGFAVRLLGIKLSVASEDRALFSALVLLVGRHLIVRSPSLPGWIAASVRDAARARGPLRSDLELLGGEAEPRGPHWRQLAIVAAVTLLFAALTAFMTYPQVRHLQTDVSPDIGDPLFSTWRLSWVAHQITRDPFHLFDGNIFYPSRNTLAFSDSMLVPSLTIAPLIWLGVPQLVAHNLLLLSGFALSAVGMFVLVRSLTGQTGAALVAGFVFGFLPFRFMHYAHLELQMAQWMPLGLWAFHRTIESGRLRDGLLTGLFFALQTLSSMYYGIFFATFLVPVAAALFVAGGRERFVRSVRPLLAGALLAGVIVAPLAIPYLAARKSVGERPLWEVQIYSARPQDYLTAHPRNATFGEEESHPEQQERELFQGFVVPLVALVGLWPPLSAARIGYVLGGLLAFDASLGLNGYSYPWLHAYVFAYKGLRVPARMAMLVGLVLSILVGFGVARLTARRGVRAASGIALVIALLVYGEYRSTLVFRHIWMDVPPVYERLRSEPPSVLMELPLKSPDIYLEPVYMYFSTFHWHKLVNGYSGFSPASYSRLLTLVAKFPDAASVAEVRARHVDFVVVHGALFDRGGGYELTVDAMDQNDNFELIGVYPWQGKDTRLYRLLPERTTSSSR